MRKEKTWNLLGMILGVIVILLGLYISQNPGVEAFQGASGGYRQGDYPDSATFGGDYYTYQYEVTRIAAENVRVAAYNVSKLGDAMTANFSMLGTSVSELSTLLASCFGMTFMIAGGLIFLVYGKKFFCTSVVCGIEDVQKSIIQENKESFENTSET